MMHVLSGTLSMGTKELKVWEPLAKFITTNHKPALCPGSEQPDHHLSFGILSCCQTTCDDLWSAESRSSQTQPSLSRT